MEILVGWEGETKSRRWEKLAATGPEGIRHHRRRYYFSWEGLKIRKYLGLRNRGLQELRTVTTPPLAYVIVGVGFSSALRVTFSQYIHGDLED